MQNNYGNRGDQELEFAGFWVRLAAYLLDLGIVWIGLVFVNLVIGIFSIATGQVFKARILFQYTLKDIILYFVQVMYFILLTYHTGTTPGKRLMNLRVVYADKSQRLGLINVIYRETVGRFLCGLSIGIGYIMAGVDREKRGLHDMLCDTRVVYGKKVKIYPVYPYPPVQPSAVQPVDPSAGVRGNTAGAPPTGTAASGQEKSFGAVSPAYPAMPHNGPYRMVQPGGQNVQTEEEKGDSDHL